MNNTSLKVSRAVSGSFTYALPEDPKKGDVITAISNCAVELKAMNSLNESIGSGMNTLVEQISKKFGISTERAMAFVEILSEML